MSKCLLDETHRRFLRLRLRIGSFTANVQGAACWAGCYPTKKRMVREMTVERLRACQRSTNIRHGQEWRKQRWRAPDEDRAFESEEDRRKSGEDFEVSERDQEPKQPSSTHV
eukprot:1188009-Rhodomonas_salina.1